MEFENIVFELDDNVAIVRINRPEKLNALNLQTIMELKKVFSLLKHEEVSAVIITGMGEKAFVAGADISEFKNLDAESGKEFALRGQEVFNIIEGFEKPVIAAVNGYALGGGCELALASHIRLASENAKFAQPEINLGLIPGYGGTQRLARLINHGRAMELILSGEQIDSAEAYRIGLVNKVYPQSDLLKMALELAKKITSKGQIAVKLAIKSIAFSKDKPLSEGLKLEAELFGECCSSEDFKEGTRAFLEKRKPEFKNK
ncbi:MAG: enoyl-CoA hydratase-related protein [Bacteroidota bacterium]|nr:enoyl-CoA hydratase-related protein [Bacteroidota bacterium]MDP4192031.1 enoyl-CoA hydratase-related protein [Bacteroidota bacterium]MDP4194690.1 enoyl-CoA hydratase-related protein [Bacteroidota bacterium]